MPPRHTVDELPAEQLQFVVDHIIDGETDREISRAFEIEFKSKLSKSALNRWRLAAGNELADRYRMAKYQAQQLIEELKESPDVDKRELLLKTIDDHLLRATKKVTQLEPFKLMLIQQEERRRELRKEELELKREQLDLRREEVRGAALDRVKLGQEYAADLLEYIGSDPEGLRWFQRHAKKFSEFIQSKYAGQ